MKKIVFADISMKGILHGACYKGSGNANCNYDKEVVYPINAVLSDKLTKEDDVKVVLIQAVDNSDEYEKSKVVKNTQLFKDELDEINKAIGAKITYVEVKTDYSDSKADHENRIMLILEQMEEGAELYGDITFGPRTVPMVMLSAFAFAEKFYDADIKKIVYGNVKWDKSGKPVDPKLFDITSLHYLNSLTYNMQPDTKEEAMKALKLFFSL